MTHVDGTNLRRFESIHDLTGANFDELPLDQDIEDLRAQAKTESRLWSTLGLPGQAPFWLKKPFWLKVLNHPAIVQDFRQFDDAEFVNRISALEVDSDVDGAPRQLVMIKLQQDFANIRHQISSAGTAENGLTRDQVVYIRGLIDKAESSIADFGKGSGAATKTIFSLLGVALSGYVIYVNFSTPDNETYNPFVVASYVKTLTQIVGMVKNPYTNVSRMAEHGIDRHSLYAIPAAFFAAPALNKTLVALEDSTPLISAASVVEFGAVAAATYRKPVMDGWSKRSAKIGDLLKHGVGNGVDKEAIFLVQKNLRDGKNLLLQGRESAQKDRLRISDNVDSHFNETIEPLVEVLDILDVVVGNINESAAPNTELGRKAVVAVAAIVPAVIVVAGVAIAKDWIAVSDFVPDTIIVSMKMLTGVFQSSRDVRSVIKDYKNYANTTTLGFPLVLANTFAPKWRTSKRGQITSAVVLAFLVNVVFGSGEVPQGVGIVLTLIGTFFANLLSLTGRNSPQRQSDVESQNTEVAESSASLRENDADVVTQQPNMATQEENPAVPLVNPADERNDSPNPEGNSDEGESLDVLAQRAADLVERLKNP